MAVSTGVTPGPHAREQPVGVGCSIRPGWAGVVCCRPRWAVLRGSRVDDMSPPTLPRPPIVIQPTHSLEAIAAIRFLIHRKQVLAADAGIVRCSEAAEAWPYLGGDEYGNRVLRPDALSSGDISPRLLWPPLDLVRFTPIIAQITSAKGVTALLHCIQLPFRRGQMVLVPV